MGTTAICDLIVACEDTYGLDVYMMIMAVNARAAAVGGKSYRVLGFISDEPEAFGQISPPVPLLGTIAGWNAEGDARYVMAIRDPARKRRAVAALKQKGAAFETLVAPWVLLPSEYETGEGCIIGNYSCKHGSRFGDFVVADTVMCESVTVGEYATLCPFSNITNSTVGSDAFIGTHAVIMEHKHVGDRASVLPGSVVLTNVKPDSTVGGVPAKRVKVL